MKKNPLYVVLTVSTVSAVLSLTACGAKAPAASASAAAAASTSASAQTTAETSKVKLKLAPEDVLTLEAQALAQGPVITGSLQPEKRADLRAEVSAVVLQVMHENGDRVKKGDVLVRLDDTSLRDNLRSAEEAQRSAALAREQAERALARLKTLRASGMATLQALDEAEVRVNSAKSEVSAAQARTVSARQQLERTVVRAPFDGVLSERKVSSGDTASIGKELVKVIDPSSMRLLGSVSTDKIAQVQLGQKVSFHVNGYGNQWFYGKVLRIDAAANDITRQVGILVGLQDASPLRVAGLYVEGIVESTQEAALQLPEAAVVRNGDAAYAWRVQEAQIKKVVLKLGRRDPRTGNYEVQSGLTRGDKIMRVPGSALVDGQYFEWNATKQKLAQSATPAREE